VAVNVVLGGATGALIKENAIASVKVARRSLAQDFMFTSEA
jgi:hypothetical protein